METAVRPVPNSSDIFVLHRIEVDAIDVTLEVRALRIACSQNRPAFDSWAPISRYHRIMTRLQGVAKLREVYSCGVGRSARQSLIGYEDGRCWLCAGPRHPRGRSRAQNRP